ncbi:MAG: triose-phosphate isomerase [Cyanobacteria bacterium]|nr:triose-phosphate isomerase [Cyanobacteriota bacterium]
MTQAHHRKRLIAGNWKMFKTPSETEAFIRALSEKLHGMAQPLSTWPEILVCPPFISLKLAWDTVDDTGKPILIGAQTMDSHEDGAFTGEISPKMLRSVCIRNVLVGHSERRQYFNETDETVSAKTRAALANDIRPIVCVGETLAEREAGQTDTVLTRQVNTALNGVSAEEMAFLVVAYEPVWAIGTGKVCDAAEANRVCHLIRTLIAGLTNSPTADQVRILYGGSVKPENFPELLTQSDIDGGLVGGASLDVDSFYQLISQAAYFSEGAIHGCRI